MVPVEHYTPLPSIEVDDNCFCANPTVLGANAGIFDGKKQGDAVYTQGCKGTGPIMLPGTESDHFTYANPDCQLGFAAGFVGPAGLTGGVSGNADGDMSLDVCPFLGQGFVDPGSGNQLPMELRSDASFQKANGGFHLERMWCRSFFGPFTARVGLLGGGFKDVCISEASPRAGDRIAAVGDWTLDHGEGWTELHDARIWTVVREDPDCDVSRECTQARSAEPCAAGFCDPARAQLCQPNDWHLITSGTFAARSWQADTLTVMVPMPPPRDANRNPLPVVPGQDVLVCVEVPLPTPTDPLSVAGCPLRGVTAKAFPDSASSSVLIRIERNDDGPQTPFQCSDASCPAVPRNADGTFDYSGYDRCNANANNNVGFAGDFLCRWKDPVDVWTCDTCRCGDPAAPGGFFTAPVQGYVAGLDPSRPQDQAAACNAVCGGLVCGGAAPACAIDACAPPPSSEARAQLVARFGGEPPPPVIRVSPVGNYTVQLEPGLEGGSKLEVGELSSSGDFSKAAETTVSGRLSLNIVNVGDERQLEFADFKLAAAPFSAFGLDFTDISAFVTYRFQGRFTSTVAFRIPRGQFNAGIRAHAAGNAGGTSIRNEDDLEGTLDLATGQFRLTGAGQNEEHKALRFTLVGRVVNRPPVAVPGPDRDVECSSATVTPVELDGAGSTDPDVGDAISHYQWFESGRGLSSQPAVTALATLGSHAYDLHVYDSTLASDLATALVRVVDTTPPALTIAEPVCLWPPNHAWARFTLADIALGATDQCDATPQVRIVSVTSNEAPDALGSGHTSRDAVFGPTTACVRSERSGQGAGRGYTVIVEARDASGNTATRDFIVLVPHDKAGHPGCVRAEGVDAPDATCAR